MATWYEEPIHWKIPWFWERLKTGGEDDDRGWDGWMASLTEWIWVEQTPGDSERQGNLVCYGPWGRKESYMCDVWVMTNDDLNFIPHAMTTLFMTSLKVHWSDFLAREGGCLTPYVGHISNWVLKVWSTPEIHDHSHGKHTFSNS